MSRERYATARRRYVDGIGGVLWMVLSSVFSPATYALVRGVHTRSR